MAAVFQVRCMPEESTAGARLFFSGIKGKKAGIGLLFSAVFATIRTRESCKATAIRMSLQLAGNDVEDKAMSKRTDREYSCFFITPIGDPDTPERKNSDMVLNYLIIPALRQCGFLKDNIVRSDKEAKTGRITERMELHIRNDDLCIVDLTGINANVMYEYGMRKGIGKPVILLAKEGTEMPFDVFDESTIFYEDPSVNVDTFFAAQEKLEKTARFLVEQGFVDLAAEGRISDIIKSLRSIEEKLNYALSARPSTSSSASALTSTNANEVSDNTNELIRKLGPIGAFNYALRQRDAALGEVLMPRLEQAVEKDKYLDAVVSQLAMMGSEKAGKILRAEWPYISANFTFKMKYEALGCYISYCNRRDSEPENLEFVLAEAERMLEEAETDVEKAGIYNQMNRIYHGAYSTLKGRGVIQEEYLDEAVKMLLKATNLRNDEPAYYFNLATCYRELHNEEKALETITKCMDLGSEEESHLVLAYEIFKARQSPRANEVYEKLVRVNQFRAEMLR